MPEILVVCTANICRSPVVEALLKIKLQENGRSHWSVHSAGTWATVPRGPSRYSLKLMQEQGIDIRAHRAKMVDENAVAQADLVLGMETGHVEALQAEFPEHAHKIHLLSELIGRHYSIQDPYGKDEDEYRQMVREVTYILDNGLGRLIDWVEGIG